MNPGDAEDQLSLVPCGSSHTKGRSFMTEQAYQATSATIALPEASALSALQASLRGKLLRPGDAPYDEARTIHNGMIDRHPALIAQCAGVADVITAVKFAHANHLLVAVRGGGHNVAGFAVCDGRLMIDLSGMKSVWVDPLRQTARAEGGATWGDFDHETQVFGLATTGGAARPTGIGGLTLGGGHGHLMRRFGPACDNLLAVDLVTADGQLRRVSATEHADLFWGVRGGGGNFGVATAFEYQLHPAGPLLGGMLIYPLHKAKEFLRLYRDPLPRARSMSTTRLIRESTGSRPRTVKPPMHGLWPRRTSMIPRTCSASIKTSSRLSPCELSEYLFASEPYMYRCSLLLCSNR
jgi:hypothetical protein